MADTAAAQLNGDVPDQLPILSRPRDQAVLAGVCAGVARRLGIQPIVVRILTVLAAILFGGLGATLYLAGMLLLPRDGEPYAPLPKAIPALRRWPTGLLATFVIFVAVAVTWISGVGPALVPAVVIGAVLWFGVFGPRHRASHTTVEPTPFERAADAWRVRLGEQQVPGFENAVEPVWQQPYTDPRDAWVSDSDGQTRLPAVPRRPRNWWLWGVAAGLVTSFVAGVIALNLILGLPATAPAFLGATLAALGVTALIATRYGRPPLLIAATVITALATLASLMPTQDGVGQVNHTYANETELPAVVRLGAGEVDLDFSQLRLTSSRSINVELAAGDAVINLPDHVRSHINWHIGAGSATVLGKSTDGLNTSDSVDLTPSGAPDDPTLTVNVRLNTGDLEVKP